MGKSKVEETFEYDYKLVDQYNRIRERENGPYAYRHIKKKKTITMDNDFELWLELQAMNCVYVIYQDEIDNDDELKSGLFSKRKNSFEMPISDYKTILSNSRKILSGDKMVYNDIFDEIEDLCQENGLNQKDRERVKELYPYLYAYVVMLEDEDVEEDELKSIISGFSKNVDNSKSEELEVHESKTSFVEEVDEEDDDDDREEEKIPVQKEVSSNINVDEIPVADESIKIVFDDNYFNYRNGKYEGQEEGDYVYSNKITGELICRENDNNLWLELQAMNFINKLFKKDLKEIKEYNLLVEDKLLKKSFSVPEKEIVIAIRMYNRSVDEKELKAYLFGLCKKYMVKDEYIEKIFELYPYFCAYVWVKSYKMSATKALNELSNVPKIVYDSEEQYNIEEEVDEKFEIKFDKEFYKYKVAIMNDNSVIYCDEANSTYISEDNKKELWVKLQAMNFIAKVYKLKDGEDFVLPEDAYSHILTSYINDEKITNEYLKEICNNNKLNGKEYQKVLGLYPYFCAYVISEKNGLSYDTFLSIVDKVKKMLNNNYEGSFSQEKTMVLNIPKDDVIDKFLNRLNQ